MDKQFFSEDHYEVLREIINIAMGQAGSALAELLDTFVELSVPSVTIISSDKVTEHVLNSIDNPGDVTAIRQAFYNHMSGEAIVTYSQEGCQELAEILGYEEEHSLKSNQELLLDVGNILVGACMNGIVDQLNPGTELSFSAPAILCEHTPIAQIFPQQNITWSYALMVKVTFRLENRAFSSHIFIFMPEESIEYMYMSKILDKWIETL